MEKIKFLYKTYHYFQLLYKTGTDHHALLGSTEEVAVPLTSLRCTAHTAWAPCYAHVPREAL